MCFRVFVFVFIPFKHHKETKKNHNSYFCISHTVLYIYKWLTFQLKLKLINLYFTANHIHAAVNQLKLTLEEKIDNLQEISEKQV